MEKLEEFLNYKDWVEQHTSQSISAAHNIIDDKYSYNPSHITQYRFTTFKECILETVAENIEDNTIDHIEPKFTKFNKEIEEMNNSIVRASVIFMF